MIHIPSITQINNIITGPSNASDSIGEGGKVIVINIKAITMPQNMIPIMK
jgi:hypothetical protein